MLGGIAAFGATIIATESKRSGYIRNMNESYDSSTKRNYATKLVRCQTSVIYVLAEQQLFTFTI